jgi:transposase-like protein
MKANSDALVVAPISKTFQATKQDKAEWAKRYLESGLSLREFSAQSGLGYMSLWRWVNKTRHKAAAKMESPTPGFTEIKLAPSVERWAAELTLPNGTVLRLSKEAPAAMLDQLLRLC